MVMHNRINLECDGIVIEQETELSEITITIRKGDSTIGVYKIGTKLELDEGNGTSFEVVVLTEVKK